MPFAFTEHGWTMLSSVLQNDKAVEENFVIVRTFVRVREILSTHLDVLKKPEDLEHKIVR